MIRRFFLAALSGLMALGCLLIATPSHAADVARINSYLNGIETLRGTFVQISPDGTVTEGLFYIRRPGRMRFEYEEPNPTLVIADGFWAAVLDRRLATVDRYPLSETPLYLLLKENVDLSGEGAIQSVESADGQLKVTAVDPGNAGQGSITMVFDAQPLALKQWIVTDPQGLTTTIALREIQQNVRIAPELFVIPEKDILDQN